MDIDDSLLDEFIAEANEHLLTIEDDFLALERQKEAPDQEIVDKVFRAIHSVKGGAAFVGLTTIKEMAHVMESLLSKVRAGELQLQSAHIDALLKGVDLLTTMIGAPLQSDQVDISSLHAHLKELVAGGIPQAVQAAPTPRPAPVQKSAPKPVPKPAPEPEVVPAPTPPEPGPELPAPPAPKPAVSKSQAPSQSLAAIQALLPGDSELELDETACDLADQALDNAEFLYYLRLRLQSDSDPGPEELLSHVEAAGEIIHAAFSHEDAAPEMALDIPLFAEFILSSPQAPEDFRKNLSFQGEDVVMVSQLAPDSDHAEEITEPTPPAAPAAPVPARTPAVPEKAAAAALAPKTPPTKVEKERGGTIRINVAILDKLMTLAGELVLVRNQQLLSMERSDALSRDMVQRLDIVTTELQESIMQTRMQPIGNIFNKLPRIVRDLSNSLDKQIEINITGNEVELDKTILESLNDPLIHIIRNCCDHGVELPEVREKLGKNPAGAISVRAFHEGGQINIEIADDGRGIDARVVRRKSIERGIRSELELSQMTDKEVLSLIMLPGFSTAESVSEISGRGVGMDVVRHAIEDLGGSLELESWPDQGTTLQLRLPLTLAIIPCLIVTVCENHFAIPQVNLEELVCLYDDDIHTRIEVAGNQEVYRLRNRLLPMVRLNEVLARPRPFTRDTKSDIAEKYHRAGPGQDSEEPPLGSAGNISDHSHFTLLPQDLERQQQESLSFAVVRVGSERFGLIVDKVLGTEEIVVKPMHPSLKTLKCYSGATVMGDGSVSLILDIEGIARHAGVFMEQPTDEIVTKRGITSSDEDTQSILLFRNGPREQFALALPLIRRIEKISLSSIEMVGNKEFITIDGQSTLVLRLDSLLTVSPCAENEEMFLILPKFINKPFGILMSHILDIEETHISLNTESYHEDGLLGTDIIRGHLTLFPDIFRLIELAEPQWFQERRQAHPPPKDNRRILIVEDSSFLRHMIRRYLEADGYDVVDTEHGQQALDTMEENDFDLVVSDIEMPVMNGLEFIKNLRHNARQHDIPALALTSLNSDEDMRRAIKAGFDLYQVKLDRELFLADVTRLLTEERPGERN